MLRLFLVASGIVCAVALDPKYIKRTESSPATSSCESVRDIPEDVSRLLQLNTSWYKQYTEANGIPIMGSAKVSKQALTRACYVVRFMFSGRQEYRDNIYQAPKFFAIIAKDEKMNDIPELANTQRKNLRRMSTTLDDNFPTTGAEENLVCSCKGDDKFWLEDSFLHEVGHTLHLIGVNPSDQTFETRVKEAHKAAKARGEWGKVHDIKNAHHEYFAEAVQSYFGQNTWLATPNSWHGPINSPEQLKEIDPNVYLLIKEMLPCANKDNYVSRCNDAMSGWAEGINQNLSLSQTCSAVVETPDVPTPYKKSCGPSRNDRYNYCFNILRTGHDYCNKEKSRVPPGAMAKCCLGACGCQIENTSCLPADNNRNCAYWAKRGDCDKNPWWMWKNCAASCKTTC